MKPAVKSDKKVEKKVEKKGPDLWLSVAFICLLASGTIGAKMLLLVDNDLELKTKFAGQSWQIDKQSLKKYAEDFDRLTTDYVINPIGKSLQQESTQFIDSAGAALVEPKNWCIPTADISAMFNNFNNSNSSGSGKSTSDKHEKIGAVDRHGIGKNSPNTNPQSPKPVARDLCITTIDRQ